MTNKTAAIEKILSVLIDVHSNSLDDASIFRPRPNHPTLTKYANEILEALESLGMVFKDSERPRVICLCGSTRFTEQMLIKQWELTKQGFVVLSWCALPDSYFRGEDKTHIGDQEGMKQIVDEVHFRRIDLADEVMILNIGGYIGESTRNELNYAMSQNKKVTYLEPI